MRIGLFGGSFNPVHNGHMKLACEALSELNLDKLIFIPSRQTPLKNEELLPASFRVKLLKLAIKKNPAFSLSLCEIQRKGISYTVDTLRYFKKKTAKKDALYFLTGADTLKNLARWKSPKEVLGLAHFTVFSRPGHLPKNLPAAALFLPFDAENISSSEIRGRLKKGKDVGKWVPQETSKILSSYFKKKGAVSSKRIK